MKRDLKDILIITSVFPVIAYIISFWFIFKHRPIHNSIMGLWSLGFFYALVTSLASILIGHPNLYATIGGVTIIFFAESASGVQHWLFALEYYYSSRIIESQILPTKKAPTIKINLFIGVAASYVFLEFISCISQYFYDKNRSNDGITRVNTVPVTFYLVLNLVSTYLLFKAIRILRAAVKKCFVLAERKFTVYTHLSLFTLQNFLIFC